MYYIFPFIPYINNKGITVHVFETFSSFLFILQSYSILLYSSYPAHLQNIGQVSPSPRTSQATLTSSWFRTSFRMLLNWLEKNSICSSSEFSIPVSLFIVFRYIICSLRARTFIIITFYNFPEQNGVGNILLVK